MKTISKLAIGIIFIIIVALVFTKLVPFAMEIILKIIANSVVD